MVSVMVDRIEVINKILTMERLIEFISIPINIDNNVNTPLDAPWVNHRIDMWQFVGALMSMLGAADGLIGRVMDGWDTQLHGYAMMDMADKMGVRCGLVDFHWEDISSGKAIGTVSLVAFPIGDGKEVIYYSPQIRCQVEGVEEGVECGYWKAHIDGIVWNTHCYKDAINATEYYNVEWFMYNDDTYKIKYSKGDTLPWKFQCNDFGIRLKHNASVQGIRCGFVTVKYEDVRWGIKKDLHVMNAFDTLDKGIVFVEPQGTQMLFTDEPKAGRFARLALGSI